MKRVNFYVTSETTETYSITNKKGLEFLMFLLELFAVHICCGRFE